MVIEENFSLLSYNTFRLPVKSKIFTEAKTVKDLLAISDLFRNYNLPKLILGGGSNILFTSDFEGIIIYPNITGTEITRQDEEFIYVKAYAGETWDEFVSFCVSNNWGGVENLSWIPGKVGACPIQNIGAYGSEVKDTVYSVEGIEIETGNIVNFKNWECKFAYRDSIFKSAFKNRFIIVSVTFKLNKKPQPNITYKGLKEALTGIEHVNIQTLRDVIIRIRKLKLPDPKELGNAGSFFKNPVIGEQTFNNLQLKHPGITFYPDGNGMYKISAASLIEKCGFKGIREGFVGTYDKQPLVIINYGKAKGSEIYNFANKIRKSVFDTFNIKLEMEVNVY